MIILSSFLLWGAAAAAESEAVWTEPNAAACAAQIVALSSEPLPEPLKAATARPCKNLAFRLYGQIVDKLVAVSVKSAAPGVVQPLTNLGGTQGGAGQGQAAPAPIPTAEAGATVAATATPTGQQLIAEVRLNPISWFADSIESKAWASRSSDVSFLVPLKAESGDLSSLNDYWGLRARVDLYGPFAAASVFSALQEAARKRQSAATEVEQRLTTVLETAADVSQCVAALQAEDAKRVSSSCGGDVSLEQLRGTDQSYREAMFEAIKAADSKYFGLDLRWDNGDPTFSGDPAKKAQNMLASLAGGGSRFFGDVYVQGRLRIGVAYAHVPSAGTYSTSVDWAAAGELGMVRDPQRIKVSVGIEGRNTFSGTHGAGDTDYRMLSIGLTVPIANSAGLSVGIQSPLAGKRPPLLAVSGDWSLLLSQLKDVSSL